MNIQLVAEDLRSRLLDAEPATVFLVQADGSVDVQLPSLISFAAIDRRRRPLATFTASHLVPAHSEIVKRLEQGLRKHGYPDALVG